MQIASTANSFISKSWLKYTFLSFYDFWAYRCTLKIYKDFYFSMIIFFYSSRIICKKSSVFYMGSHIIIAILYFFLSFFKCAKKISNFCSISYFSYAIDIENIWYNFYRRTRDNFHRLLSQKDRKCTIQVLRWYHLYDFCE